jgi:septal ring factor EnvC (AmiA/AmiB activator)
MTNKVFLHFDNTSNDFNPELQDKYKYLKKSIKDQKEENANLMKQIEHLNQEISTIFENMNKLGFKLEVIEKTAGIERGQDAYDQEDF